MRPELLSKRISIEADGANTVGEERRDDRERRWSCRSHGCYPAIGAARFDVAAKAQGRRGEGARRSPSHESARVEDACEARVLRSVLLSTRNEQSEGKIGQTINKGLQRMQSPIVVCPCNIFCISHHCHDHALKRPVHLWLHLAHLIDLHLLLPLHASGP